MAISATVKRHLADNDIPYEVIPHGRTGSSTATAAAAHISAESMAKAVVLKDEEGYLLAVMPATCRLSAGEIYDFLGRRLQLAREEELADLFKDCDLGAVPPLAEPYGLEAVWDESLGFLPEVYFEGGDHGSLVRVASGDFRRLMGDARHAYFSHRM